MNPQEFDQLVAKETSLIAYLDLSNMFHWQDTLKWQFSIYDVIKQLLAVKNLKEVRVYYGLNERELEKSNRFHRRLRETGSILVTKPVKWIRKEINRDLKSENPPPMARDRVYRRVCFQPAI